MSPDGLRAAAAKLSNDLQLLDRQFEEGNISLLAAWEARRRAALGLLGEVCLGVESNQALLRLSGGCELLVGVVESTGDADRNKRNLLKFALIHKSCSLHAWTVICLPQATTLTAMRCVPLLLFCAFWLKCAVATL
jgi:hypothetical protein